MGVSCLITFEAPLPRVETCLFLSLAPQFTLQLSRHYRSSKSPRRVDTLNLMEPYSHAEPRSALSCQRTRAASQTASSHSPLRHAASTSTSTSRAASSSSAPLRSCLHHRPKSRRRGLISSSAFFCLIVLSGLYPKSAPRWSTSLAPSRPCSFV